MSRELTQEQQWGLEYLLQLHNETVKTYNDSLPERNRFIPRDQPLLEPKPVLTVEQFIDSEIARIADNGYQQLLAKKEQMTKEAFAQASNEQKQELFALLGVPDILKGPATS